MAASSSGRSKVFISYSHVDKDYLARLQQYLKPHVREGTIPLWVDTQLKAGDEWYQEIEQALLAARVAILLVSVDFLASDFIAEEELPRLLAAAKEQGAVILPVILTPCLFRRTKLSQFQAINDPTRPLSLLPPAERDLVWDTLVERVLEALDSQPSVRPPEAPAQPVPMQPRPVASASEQTPSAAVAVSLQPTPTSASAFPPPPPTAYQQPTAQAGPVRAPVRPGKFVRDYTGHSPQMIFALAGSPDGKRVASGGEDYEVHVWDPATGASFLTYKGHEKTIKAIAWAPSSRHLVSGDDNGNAHVIDVQTGQALLIYTADAEQMYALAWSPDGSRVASAEDNIYVWLPGTGQRLLTYSGHTRRVVSLAWSPNGTYIASGSEDRTVHIWNAANGQRLVSYPSETSGLSLPVAWAPDSRRLACGSYEAVTIWDIATNQPSVYKLPSGEAVGGVAWSPDGRRLAVCGSNRPMSVWDTTTGQRLFECEDGSSNMYGLAWAQEGKLLVSASHREVSVWTAG